MVVLVGVADRALIVLGVVQADGLIPDFLQDVSVIKVLGLNHLPLCEFCSQLSWSCLL